MIEAGKPEQTGANVSGTDAGFDAKLTRARSPDVLNTTIRDLIVMRNKHGALSAIGSRCSNIVELIQLPEIPRFQLERQMADLQRLLAAH